MPPARSSCKSRGMVVALLGCRPQPSEGNRRTGDGASTRSVGETIAHVPLIGHAAHVKVREVKACQAAAIHKHPGHIRYIHGTEV